MYIEAKNSDRWCCCVISSITTSSCGELQLPLSCCKSSSFFPPLIKLQRLLSSSAKGAQMRTSGAEGGKQAEAAEAERRISVCTDWGHTHKVSQNSCVDVWGVCWLRNCDAYSSENDVSGYLPLIGHYLSFIYHTRFSDAKWHTTDV